MAGKLSGEQLLAKLDDHAWELAERAESKNVQIGLPNDPKKAKRAGRDEVIRQLSASEMSHADIAEITDLSRTTVDIAVDRARALQVNGEAETPVTLETIGLRLSAFLDLIEHSQEDLTR